MTSLEKTRDLVPTAVRIHVHHAIRDSAAARAAMISAAAANRTRAPGMPLPPRIAKPSLRDAADP